MLRAIEDRLTRADKVELECLRTGLDHLAGSGRQGRDWPPNKKTAGRGETRTGGV